jgi:hypothetical protein
MKLLNLLTLWLTPAWRFSAVALVALALAGLATPGLAGGAAVALYAVQAAAAVLVFLVWRVAPHWQVRSFNESLLPWQVGLAASALEFAAGLVAAWQGAGWLAAAMIVASLACAVGRAVWLVFD